MKERFFLMRRIHLVLLLTIAFPVQAQLTYLIDQSIPVKDNSGHALTLPWSGGLNASQFSTMDLDHDNAEDLIVFDRMANKVITFLNKNHQYEYHPEYEGFFPAEVTNWLLLRDYNCDGKKDIFTGSIFGIAVFTNVTPDDGPPAWKQVLFYSGVPGSTKSTAVLTKGFTSKVNLQLQYDDLPSVEDADGDGDLDIFNMRYAANGTIEYHQNFSLERYGTCDSLDFERQTTNWGGLTECACGVFALHNEDCPPIGGRTKHAGGKSLLAIDLNNDGQKDILFSEAACDQLFQLTNDGTLENAEINTFVPYPRDHPTDFYIFPAAYYEDVDFDGKKDLITSPNIYSKVYLESDLRRSNWLYKNTGTDENPAFHFTQDNFLQENMIDVGDNSIPAFIDYDADGDQDLFLSHHATATDNFNATIFLYENTGSAGQPEFTLKNDDYLNFSSSGLYNLRIQFADINHDGARDLVFTATTITTGITNLFFLANKNKSGVDFSGQTPQLINFTLLSTENVYVTDVNNDGAPDILLGKSNGALEYWKNSGFVSAIAFTLEDATYLGLNSSTLRQNIACTTGDLDNDGKTDLVYGDQTGVLKIVSDYRHVTDAVSAEATDFIFNPLNNTYEQRNLGAYVWPVTVNLFNSTHPSIVTGNILGGIYVLKNDGGESLPDSPVLDVYPNPVSRKETVYLRTDRPGVVTLLSVLGQKVSDSFDVQAHAVNAYALSSLAPGVYIIKFTVNNKSFSKRIVIY